MPESDPPLRQSRRDWAVMLAGSAARISMGLAFVPYVLSSLSAADTTRILQLLFIQGGLTALLSASAYARGAHLASVGAPLGPSLRAFARFLAITASLACALGVALVPATSSHGTTAIVLMVLGSAASALNGLLQGTVVVRAGGVAAFWPTTLVNVLGIVALCFAWGTNSPWVAALLWVLPQVLSPVVLVVARSEARQWTSRSAGAGYDEGSHFAAVGAVNAASIGVAYQYREQWAEAQSTIEASHGFGVVRLTELVYQVAYMGAASVPQVIERHVVAPLRRANGRWALSLVGFAAAVLGLLPTLILDKWSLPVFLIAEAAVMPARLMTIVCLLALLGRRTTKAYQAVMATMVVFTAGLLALPAAFESPYGLQAFQCVAALTAVAGTTAAFGRDARASTSGHSS